MQAGCINYNEVHFKHSYGIMLGVISTLALITMQSLWLLTTYHACMQLQNSAAVVQAIGKKMMTCYVCYNICTTRMSEVNR